MSWHFLQEGEEASWQHTCLDGAPDALLKLMPERGESCLTGSATEYSNTSQYGMTCEPSTEQLGAGSLMLSRADSRAKTSANAERVPGLAGSGQDSGWSKIELFAKYDPSSSLWKTRQCSLLADLEQSLEIWPEWGSMQGGECFERQPLERLTTEPGFTWLLTPTAQSWKAWTFRNPLKLIRRNHADGNLQEQLMRLYQRMTTPRCQEILMMWPEGWTDSKPLAMDGFQKWQQEQCGF
jgi:hypothetical protein